MAKRVFRTKKVLSGARTEYRAWNEWDEGDILIAKLVGDSPNRKNKSKLDWIVEPIEAHFSDKKEQKRIMAAKLLTLNSAGQFDKSIVEIKEDVKDKEKIFQVTYNGSKEMEGGSYAGQSAHTMEVVSLEEERKEKQHEEEHDDEESVEEEYDEDEDDL